MGSSRGRRLPMMFMLVAIVVAMVVAICVALDAGTAVAQKQARKTDAKIVAKSFQVAASQTGEAYAKCPGNKRALGGGVVESGPPDNLFVHASGPLNAGGTTAGTKTGDVAKQWYAAVRNNSGGPVDFKVFAICSAKTKATIVAKSFQVGGNKQTGEAYAKCPGNKRALGGGVVESGPPDNLWVDASGPLNAGGTTAGTKTGDVAKQWYAAVNNDTNVTVDFKVFAICR
jgi:hypothetical protein